MKRLLLKLLLATLALGSSSAYAQSYPAKPIRIVVPFATGGFADIAGRRIAQELSQNLGVAVIVENRAGAGGQIGADHVAKSPADGYTLLLGSNGPLTVGPSLYDKVPYDPIKDFEPVILLGASPTTLLVNPSLPAANLKEFVAYLKANPGKVSVASPGIGTSSHLAGELFQIVTGTKMLHVPYKGSGPAMSDLVGGQVNAAFDPLSSSLALAKSGKLRALAVAGDKRAPALPDVPTMGEAGVADYDASTFVALLAPAGTPRAIVAQLNAAAAKALESAAVKESFAQFATLPLGGPPDQLTGYLKQDLAKWKKVIQTANVKPE
jgi:tripartite-type tricarboxylate transporter receptor subunit TctC